MNEIRVLAPAKANPLTGSIKCIDCGRPTKLQIVEVERPSDHRKLMKHFQCCTWCKARYSCNHLGEIHGFAADRATRYWRAMAHDAFDPIWIEAKGLAETKDFISRCRRNRQRSIRRHHMTYRRRCYQWLAERLGWMEDMHISQLNIDQCKNVIAVCEGVTLQHIITWWKIKNGTF